MMILPQLPGGAPLFSAVLSLVTPKPPAFFPKLGCQLPHPVAETASST